MAIGLSRKGTGRLLGVPAGVGAGMPVSLKSMETAASCARVNQLGHSQTIPIHAGRGWNPSFRFRRYMGLWEPLSVRMYSNPSFSAHSIACTLRPVANPFRRQFLSTPVKPVSSPLGEPVSLSRLVNPIQSPVAWFRANQQALGLNPGLSILCANQ